MHIERDVVPARELLKSKLGPLTFDVFVRVWPERHEWTQVEAAKKRLGNNGGRVRRRRSALVGGEACPHAHGALDHRARAGRAQRHHAGHHPICATACRASDAALGVASKAARDELPSEPRLDGARGNPGPIAWQTRRFSELAG